MAGCWLGYGLGYMPEVQAKDAEQQELRMCAELASIPPTLPLPPPSRVLMQKVAKELLGMISWPAVQVGEGGGTRSER